MTLLMIALENDFPAPFQSTRQEIATDPVLFVRAPDPKNDSWHRRIQHLTAPLAEEHAQEPEVTCGLGKSLSLQ